MKKFSVLMTIFVMTFVLALTGCDLINYGTESSYTFEWYCSSSANYVDITPSNGGSPSSFRLSASNPKVTVTWEDEGNDYYGGFTSTSNYTSGTTAPWFKRYDAIKKVCWYNY